MISRRVSPGYPYDPRARPQDVLQGVAVARSAAVDALALGQSVLSGRGRQDEALAGPGEHEVRAVVGYRRGDVPGEPASSARSVPSDINQYWQRLGRCRDARPPDRRSAAGRLSAPAADSVTTWPSRLRTLPNLAQEKNTSTASMPRWTHHHQIPLRPPRRWEPRLSLRTMDRAAGLPSPIDKALTSPHAWQRLNRFANAIGYQTLSEAAEHLGITQSTLVTQINRLERNIGSLLERAERGRSMSPTTPGPVSKSSLPFTQLGCLLSKHNQACSLR